MAKPRVTYESSGDYLRPPQNIDFAGQRENIAGYTQMTQKLDQMSNYFMQLSQLALNQEVQIQPVEIMTVLQIMLLKR